MNMDVLKEKVDFVKEINDAVIKVQPNVIKMYYEVYEYVEHPGNFKEFLVIEYAGGAKTVRNCTADSCSAIVEEIGKYLHAGYYDEVANYNNFVNSTAVKKIF